MTRLGAGILLVILGAVLAFAAMLSFGPAPPPSLPAVSAGSAPMSGPAPTVREGASAPGAAPLRYPQGRLVVPVRGVAPAQVADSWHDSRGGGTRQHTGTDIMAPGGTPVLAAADGRIEKLYVSEGGGGITLYERSVDGAWVYYYAHLAGYAPGIAEGRRVRAGEPIAYVGDTGNAGAGNTHLHFGMSRIRADERWWQGTPVNPYPLLARAAVAR